MIAILRYQIILVDWWRHNNRDANIDRLTVIPLSLSFDLVRIVNMELIDTRNNGMGERSSILGRIEK
jgi:hypothetical protein